MAVEAEAETGGLRGDTLIVFQCAVLPITFITTYIIATSNNHVEKNFPYVSDTGTWPPESCIFGFLLCFYSLATFIAVHIRWVIVRRFSPPDTSTTLNNASFGVGIVAALGVLIVATFQETSQLIVHLLGAMMAFYIGIVYMWQQTVLSWRLPEVPGFTRNFLFLRLAITILSTISAIPIMPFAVASRAAYRGNETKTWRPGSGKQDPSMGGHDYHVTSAAFEWALCCLATLFFLTFVREFRHIRFGMPSIHVTSRSANGNNDTEFSGGNEKTESGIDNIGITAD